MKSLYDGEEAGAGFVPAFERNPDGTLNTDHPFVGSENLIDFELGASWSNSLVRVSANLFHMDFRDESVASGGWYPFGVASSWSAD